MARNLAELFPEPMATQAKWTNNRTLYGRMIYWGAARKEFSIRTSATTALIMYNGAFDDYFEHIEGMIGHGISETKA